MTKPKIQVVFDAGPLITACKFKSEGKLVIDHLLLGCFISIAQSVCDEVAVVGARYPDGEAAGQRIADGFIRIVPVTSQKWARQLAGYAMGNGEKDSISLCGQLKDIEALVTDDYLAFVAATRLGQKAWMLPDMILEMGKCGSMTIESAQSILSVIRPRYRPGVIEHSLEGLKEVKVNA
ncbi:MAG: hypothetical protein H8E10_02955 [Desulfobacterales bacterium]|nr:hypothetical protein [Desulfobacterales bacterium]